MGQAGKISATMLLFLSAVLLAVLVSTVGPTAQGASQRGVGGRYRTPPGDVHDYAGLQLQYVGKTSDGQYEFHVDYDGSLGCVTLYDNWANLFNGLVYNHNSRYSCGGVWRFAHGLATPGIGWNVSVHDDSAPGFRIWSSTVGIKTSP